MDIKLAAANMRRTMPDMVILPGFYRAPAVRSWRKVRFTLRHYNPEE
ncbi:hypothetical protein [Bradyrhizobium sp.]